MGRRQERELFHRLQHLRIDEPRAAHRTSVHGLEADGGQLRQVPKRLALAGDLRHAVLNGRRIVRAHAPGLSNAFNPPLGQDAVALDGVELVLERRAADIDDENVHTDDR